MIGNGRVKALNTPIRRIQAAVDILDSDKAYIDYLTYRDKLKSFTIERVGEEGKFFGFGICQKLNLHLTSLDYKLTTEHILVPTVWDIENYGSIYPEFNVTEVHKDENSGELSITAYDAIYKAAGHTINELNTTATTITQFAEEIALFLGCYGFEFVGNGSTDCFNVIYDETAIANFDGAETIREVLDDIAEATQTVYYVRYDNYLIFKRLDKDGIAAITITKDDYITMDSGENRRLTKLVSATDLGDNLEATLKGTTSGASVTVNDVSPEAHEVAVKVASKNIFDINTSRLGDLTNISAWAGIVLNPSEVREIFKPSKTYTAQFIAEGLANISYSTVYDAHIGFMLHCRNPVKTVAIAGTYRSGTSTAQVLTLGKTVEVSGTFTAPYDLNINDYELLIYTQRCLDTSGAPVLNTLKFSNIQIEEGIAATSYTPYIAPEEVTVSVWGEDASAAVTYIPEASGTVSGVTSVAPTMNITTDKAGVIISATYERNNTISGSTQYVRNNAFWDLRADRVDLIDKALAQVWGITINQFECEWRGNYLLEIGDKIDLITKDNTVVTSYVLNDVIEYNGGFKERTSWHYTETEETAANASNLGEVLKQTYTRVDKVNKEIEMVASQVDGHEQSLAQLYIDTENIRGSVTSTKSELENSIANVNSNVNTLTSKVEAAITAEDVQLKIEQELSNGVDKVITSTGYTFNDEGLTVEKSGSEMKTTISDDGMKVYRNNHEVLTADNTGVKAENLHATTYLIIGNNSRFEDYGGRTGCFWIG